MVEGYSYGQPQQLWCRSLGRAGAPGHRAHPHMSSPLISLLNFFLCTAEVTQGKRRVPRHLMEQSKAGEGWDRAPAFRSPSARPSSPRSLGSLRSVPSMRRHSPPRGSARHSPSPLPPKHSIVQMENRGAARHSPLAYKQASSAALWRPRLPPAGDGFWQRGEFLFFRRIHLCPEEEQRGDAQQIQTHIQLPWSQYLISCHFHALRKTNTFILPLKS